MNDFVPTYGSMIILSWHSLNLCVSVMLENLLISNGKHGKFTFNFVTFSKIIKSYFFPYSNVQSANTGTFLKCCAPSLTEPIFVELYHGPQAQEQHLSYSAVRHRAQWAFF
jgi:hypothetical protein